MNRIRRPEPSRGKKKAILISVEDKKSSRLYFERFRDALRTDRVVVLADYLGSDPKTVIIAAKTAVAARQKLVDLDMADSYEEVWIVFDTEGPQNARRLAAARNAIEQARELKYHVAVSNPCFEYWLILHFEYYVGQLADGLAARKRLERHLKKKYSKSDCCFDETYGQIQIAIDNSEKVWRERHATNAHPCDCHPSTEIHKLAKSLLGND